MTDITELAQRVKTEASAIDDTQWYLAKPSEIRSLLEALEKAQAQSSKWLEAYHKAISVGARYEERIAELEEVEQKLCAANVTLDARAELAERQLAELESRSVKLPEPFKLAKSSSGLTYYYADEVNEALSAAGIKWEAE
ncbi:hypothetical protein ACLH2L_10605 [Klebsiella grimontii]|uniref:hypothetical protein n=1 Tax=Klebsiella grimontii TaxID=2058152 RepID=UPI003983A94A